MGNGERLFGFIIRRNYPSGRWKVSKVYTFSGVMFVIFDAGAAIFAPGALRFIWRMLLLHIFFACIGLAPEAKPKNIYRPLYIYLFFLASALEWGKQSTTVNYLVWVEYPRDRYAQHTFFFSRKILEVFFYSIWIWVEESKAQPWIIWSGSNTKGYRLYILYI